MCLRNHKKERKAERERRRNIRKLSRSSSHKEESKDSKGSSPSRGNERKITSDEKGQEEEENAPTTAEGPATVESELVEEPIDGRPKLGDLRSNGFFRTETTLFSHSIFYLKDDKERLVRKVCHGEMAGAIRIPG